MKTSFAETLHTLSSKLPGFDEALANDRQGFDAWACMPIESYRNKDVLDLGCGLGAASSLFIERGAQFVWGIDPVMTAEQINTLSVLPRTRFTSSLLRREVFGHQRFDLVYARFATEHILDLPDAFSSVYSLLKPGGRFVALHGNYYSPMGAHDHALIWPVKPGRYTYRSQALPCWRSSKKCEISAEFRKEMEEKYDWSIRAWKLTPNDCTQCPYYQRAQLWGHLLYQDHFNQDYPGGFFKTDATGGLNKVTPFQLKQFLIEAGFKLTSWTTPLTTDRPPAALKRIFHERDLRIVNILFAADKPTA